MAKQLLKGKAGRTWEPLHLKEAAGEQTTCPATSSCEISLSPLLVGEGVWEGRQKVSFRSPRKPILLEESLCLFSQCMKKRK